MNTIDGGGSLGGLTTQRSRKKLTRAGNAHEFFNVHQYRSSTAPKTGWSPITFDESEEGSLQQPHNDPFLITAKVDQFRMARILIYNGSTVNVLFSPTYQQLEHQKSKLYQDHEPLLSFSSDITQPLGSDSMNITLGTTRTSHEAAATARYCHSQNQPHVTSQRTRSSNLPRRSRKSPSSPSRTSIPIGWCR